MKKKVTLQVEVTIDLTDGLAGKQDFEHFAVQHTKNCLMDNPDVDNYTIVDTNVKAIKVEDAEPTRYDIMLPNGLEAQVVDAEENGNNGINVLVDDKVLVFIPILHACDVYADEEWYNRFCEDFKYLTSIKHQAAVAKRKYVQQYKKEPLYADCHINFKNEDAGYDVTIKLVPSTEEEQEGEGDDNKIFFYCNGVDEFVKLTQQDNGEDFVVTDFFGFYGNL